MSQCNVKYMDLTKHMLSSLHAIISSLLKQVNLVPSWSLCHLIIVTFSLCWLNPQGWCNLYKCACPCKIWHKIFLCNHVGMKIAWTKIYHSPLEVGSLPSVGPANHPPSQPPTQPPSQPTSPCLCLNFLLRLKVHRPEQPTLNLLAWGESCFTQEMKGNVILRFPHFV